MFPSLVLGSWSPLLYGPLAVVSRIFADSHESRGVSTSIMVALLVRRSVCWRCLDSSTCEWKGKGPDQPIKPGSGASSASLVARRDRRSVGAVLCREVRRSGHTWTCRCVVSRRLCVAVIELRLRERVGLKLYAPNGPGMV